MSDFSLPKTYDFHAVEQRLYAWWDSQGYFRPKVDPSQRPFVISMPPPNVTGELHLGHAMFVAMEDLMTRYHRMRGVPTLWLPGSDHAGIATQLQVEKELLRTEEVTREEIGREAFVARTWEWKRKYGGIITQQLRRLGASCDWSRERFTLDDGLSRAVREAFVRLYEKGLIYRGTYLINWSPGLRTAVSDLEVEYSEEQGTLYTFKYPLAGSDEFIPVATTRPETILGDTAVAVHPEDERYRHLIGKTCLVPILNRPIPVIEDAYVDREFGTGALKITPGHDPADYEIGQRHGLPIVNVLHPDATMNENAGPYAGLDRYDCRERIWKDMQTAGLTIRTEPYTMQVPRSQRGGEIVEPLVSTQWFVRMKPLSEPALNVVRDGRIRIVPERFTKVYFNWLENIRDWCISRQLWWGHRIPAWHCADCTKITVARTDPDRCAHCGSSRIEQDPDVLDTWFSSGLWPFSTLGWPEDTPDLRAFYPTSVMETGYDILFFWVARMIMMGLEFTGREPFHTVYLHGLIRDERGRKMSKTLGNFIDPLVVMDEFGTDALRFYLLTSSTPGNDINVSVDRVEANRNFANKLWNAGRLVLGAVERAGAQPDRQPPPTLADRWIRARLSALVREVGRLFEGYQFGEAGRQIYEFFWAEYADWYLEIAKLQLDESPERAWSTAKHMVEILDTCLRLLHPYTPFVTEELWGKVRGACLARQARLQPEGGWEEALIVARWPEAAEATEDEAVAQVSFGKVMDIIKAIRNVRSEKGVEPSRRIAAEVSAGADQALLEEHRGLLSHLARLDPQRLTIAGRLPAPPKEALPLVVGTIEVYLPLTGMVDVVAEGKRLDGEMAQAATQIARLEELLAGPFKDRAPADVVAKERAKLEALRATRQKLEMNRKALG
ncbi:MAG TPA: valine--tRNA ligase [Anaerolineales bacterium]|nr:valine--tRNA ligase [Anaerolineales bacterium]